MVGFILGIILRSFLCLSLLNGRFLSFCCSFLPIVLKSLGMQVFGYLRKLRIGNLMGR